MRKLILSICLSAAALSMAVTIQEINGPTVYVNNGTEVKNYYVSPYSDQVVSGVEGIVTAIKYNKASNTDPTQIIEGFYIQSVTPDNDTKTSEGIYVYSKGTFNGSVEVGERVIVGGKVKEYKFARSLSVRELVGESANPITVQSVSTGNPVRVLKIGTKVDPSNPNKRLIPTGKLYDYDYSQTTNSPDEHIDLLKVNTTSFVNPDPKPFNPELYGLDFWRSIMGELVEIDNPMFCAPTYFTVNGTKKTTNYLVADNGEGATGINARGGITIQLEDRNPEMIAIEPSLFYPWINNCLPQVVPGDKINGSFQAIVDYTYTNFKLFPTDSTKIAQSIVVPANNPKEITALTAMDAKLTIASFNVENLNPMDSQEKFDNLALGIINNLKNPDIIGVEEVQDNNGTADGGITAADQTFVKLLAAISAQGGPNYDFRQVDPVNKEDGGAPVGNIRCGFIYNPARVTFVDRAAPAGTSLSTSAVQVVNNNGIPELSWSPGRINPTAADSAWFSSRKPLIGEFKFNNTPFFVTVNHFGSKGGDQYKYQGNLQGPYLFSEKQRMKQATHVANFIQSILAIKPNANIIALGDWNDFQFSNPLRRLTGDDTGTRFMYPLDEVLPENERYAYSYAGNSQALDHILVSKNIWDGVPEFDYVHINSEYASDNRLSDHDPEVARLSLMGVGIEDDFVAAKSMKMTSYPNPFNPSTTISFALAKTANVELAIYNTVGEKVATLVNGAMNQGVNSIVWNAAKFNSGIYYAQLSVDNKMIQTSKMMLVK